MLPIQIYALSIICFCKSTEKVNIIYMVKLFGSILGKMLLGQVYQFNAQHYFNFK